MRTETEIEAIATAAVADHLKGPFAIAAVAVVERFLRRLIELAERLLPEEFEEAVREGRALAAAEVGGDRELLAIEDELLDGPVSAAAGYPEGYEGDDDDVADELLATKDAIIFDAINALFSPVA